MAMELTENELAALLEACFSVVSCATVDDFAEALPALFGAAIQVDRVEVSSGCGAGSNVMPEEGTGGRLGSERLIVDLDAGGRHVVAYLTRNKPFTKKEETMAALLRAQLQPALARISGAGSAGCNSGQQAAADLPEGMDAVGVLCRLGLSKREAEVLWWVSNGKVNKEIAMILGVSFRTVQKHVENLLRKLDLENRHAAAVYAIQWLDQQCETCPLRLVKRAYPV